MFVTYSNRHRYTGELKILHGYVLPGADQERTVECEGRAEYTLLKFLARAAPLCVKA
jgi:hypothetical protein